jgi:hypothetical protein
MSYFDLVGYSRVHKIKHAVYLKAEMDELHPFNADHEIRVEQARHEIDMENRSNEAAIVLNENQLKTCCGAVSDKRLLIFTSSFSISLIVVAFCCYQLTNNLSCENQQTYVGLLTLVIGIWLKSPIN